MNYKAIIFDMDGTLLNTIEDITDSANHIMEQFHMPTRTVEEVKHFVGNGAVRLMEQMVPDGQNNPLFKEVLDAYSAYYLEHCNIKTGPYTGILDLLKELKKRGYLMAVVSNKSMDGVKELVKQYFADYITVSVGVTPTLQRKPAPDQCIEAMRLLGVSKEDCIYIGDSEVDHMTAKNTGIPCISCLWGFRTKEELLKAGAEGNIFVNEPMEVIGVIGDVSF